MHYETKMKTQKYARIVKYVYLSSVCIRTERPASYVPQDVSQDQVLTISLEAVCSLARFGRGVLPPRHDPTQLSHSSVGSRVGRLPTSVHRGASCARASPLTRPFAAVIILGGYRLTPPELHKLHPSGPHVAPCFAPRDLLAAARFLLLLPPPLLDAFLATPPLPPPSFFAFEACTACAATLSRL